MRTLFFDVDTQLDFLLPAGALSVPGAEQLAEPLGKLTRFAEAKKVQIISTVDAHTEDDAEFSQWPPHCIAGTLGQAKASFTHLQRRTILPNVAMNDEAIRTTVIAPQIVLEKQSTDCFTQVNLRPILNAIEADRYVVYGVAADVCVARALFGLLQRGKQVELVADAVKPISTENFRNVTAHFQAAGGLMTTVNQVTASRAS